MNAGDAATGIVPVRNHRPVWIGSTADGLCSTRISTQVLSEIIEQVTGRGPLPVAADVFSRLANRSQNVLPNNHSDRTSIIALRDPDKDDPVQPVRSVRPQMSGD